MKKVITIVGTRPELIKLSAVIKKLDVYCDHLLVHTGQNYDYALNKVFFDDLNIREPDFFLETAAENFAYSLSNLFSKVYDLLNAERPDCILVYGDTNSCLSVIIAKRLKIPIFHMEAGNRCFDENVPEELNRKIIDHTSDINLPISEHARDYLISEGRRPERTIKIGSSMLEVINNQKALIEDSTVCKRLGLSNKKYFVVSLHREENVDSIDSLKQICLSLNDIYEKYKFPIVFSVHPRTRARMLEFDLKKVLNNNILFTEPFGFNDYMKLQQNAFCVISDSGTISEESSIFNFPAITLRTAHERPEAMDEGTLIMTGLRTENVLISIDVVTNTYLNRKLVYDYSVDNVSDKVLKIILSYTDYVNDYVWRK